MALQTKTITQACDHSYTLKLQLTEDSTNTNSNTSSVSWALVLTSGSYSFSDFRIGWSVSLNGSVVSSQAWSTASYRSIGKNSSLTIASGTSTITHGADGTLNMAAAASMEISKASYGPVNGSSGTGTVSLSGSMALTAIPRASTLTVPSTMTMGTASTLVINRNSSSFTHSISYKVGSGSYQSIVSKTSNTSVSWTPPISLIESFSGTSGTVTIKLETYNGNTLVGSAATYTSTVNAPAKSTMSVPTFTAGTAGTFSISRKSSSYKHTIQYKFGSVAWTAVVTKTTSTSVSWTPDLSLLQQMPSATSKTETNGLRLYTYYNDTLIGTTYYDLTIKAGSSAKPTVSFTTLTPDNSDQNATVQGWGYYIKGLSKISYAIGFTGYQGSTVSAREFVGNGQTLTTASGTTNVLASSGTVVVKARVKDSRSRWSNYVTQNLTVYDYIQPQMTASSAFRSNSSGTAADDGTYIHIQCTANVGATINSKNKITISYMVKQGSTVKASNTLSAGTTTLNVTLSGYDTTKSYSVTITATDTVGNSVIRVIGIPTSTVTFHLKEGGRGAAFGKYAETNDAVDFGTWKLIGRLFTPDPGKSLAGTETLTDLDAGQYTCSSGSIAEDLQAVSTGNCPTQYNFMLFVFNRISTPRKTMILVNSYGDIFVKSQSGASSWTSWKQVTMTTVS